jgi:transcriptional regulator with XRE-family HTH domain
MKIQKTSEKILIWMHRDNITQQQIAARIGITRQTWAKKMKDNTFTPKDIVSIQALGFRDES